MQSAMKLSEAYDSQNVCVALIVIVPTLTSGDSTTLSGIGSATHVNSMVQILTILQRPFLKDIISLSKCGSFVSA
jgi:hypothetical protein